MNHETAVSNAKEIADRILAPAARQNDKEARFSSEAIAALGPAGLLGIMLPTEVGGAALGPRTLAAVIATLRRSGRIRRDGLSDAPVRHRDDRGGPSGRRGRADAKGHRGRPTPEHPGLQRSRIAQPLLGAGLAREAQRRRRAPHGQEIVGDERRSRAKLCRLGAVARREESDGFDPLPLSQAARPDCRSRAHGTVSGCAPMRPRR